MAQPGFMRGLLGTALAVALVVAACAQDNGGPAPEEEVSEPAMKITSTAFTDGERIPVKYTCDGEDVSPPLRMSEMPEGTLSLAIIADDPDAPRGTWVHWVVGGIPPDTTDLPENYAADLPGGARHGTNDFGDRGYGGPCPPQGSAHRYFFKVYALDKEIDLKPGAAKADLLREMEGSILGTGQLIGTYQRR